MKMAGSAVSVCFFSSPPFSSCLVFFPLSPTAAQQGAEVDGSPRGQSSLNKGEEREKSVDAAFHSEWMSPVYTLNSVRPPATPLPPMQGRLHNIASSPKRHSALYFGEEA